MAQFTSITYAGVCHRNIIAGPAIAKEYPCAEAAKHQSDSDGKMLSEDETVFWDKIITDEDTRSSVKFIRKTIETIDEAAEGFSE